MWWNIHRKFATNLAALYLFCMTYYATNIVMNQFQQVFKVILNDSCIILFYFVYFLSGTIV